MINLLINSIILIYSIEDYVQIYKKKEAGLIAILKSNFNKIKMICKINNWKKQKILIYTKIICNNIFLIKEKIVSKILI